MDVATEIQVVKVAPITFIVTVNATSVQNVSSWKSDLMRRHCGVAEVTVASGFHVPGVRGLVNEIKITMDADADYQQLCALRAELKA
ncbi:MAG: hypothetical protein H6797_02905 [Candidatus Nomurabacteria bacterium]|nr:MAG: hypothetical protein H6797_02905 [Candidatus Nomurabacteria bacterium]